MNYNLFRNDFFERNRSFKESEYLKTDIYEKEETYYLEIEVPGVEKENLDIGYENGYLTVTVKQEQEYQEDYIRKERITSEMQRTFYVGDIEEDTIKANYQNGILYIRLEKMKENAKTKKQIIIE